MSPRRVQRRASAPAVPAIPAGSWAAAGYRFFKQVIVPPIPQSAYTSKATGLVMSGGQAAGNISALGTLTLTVGPQGLGTTWYPAQVTLSTSAGPLDTSTATVWLGVGGVPTSQVGQVFSGNGVLALAIPPMQVGEFLIVTWTGGTPGNVASLNVIGTMDALIVGG